MLDTAWDAAAISAHERRSWSTVAAELLEIFEAAFSVSSALSRTDPCLLSKTSPPLM
jgi:hypothetical protein